ncbi:MAG: prolyl oligopeptidase family serine peptidase, partial [Muribaculaceae bacterium]|nr:prolyl oligopeptidase family serine peptidase [Muribaculaceae bacterium]
IYVDESSAWIAPACYEKAVFDKNSFVVFSDRTGYSQLYRYSYSGSLLGRLTDFAYDVTAYYGTGADGSVYFQSTGGNPINRVVSMTDRKGKTVNLSPVDGTASAVFSPAMNYYSLTYSNISEPPVQTLYTSMGKKVRVLEDNSAYRSNLPRLSVKEFFKFATDGVELNGYMIKPTDFSATKKYPVIMSQYSGPGSQSVLNRWSLDWEQYYASKGYVIICVDGRGTGGRGRAFMDVVYKRLGQYETKDQVAAARYAASLPFVDASRIGIYGWSYGGYEALMAASAADCPYAAAVAIAPVTDWRYYDTVYAERYMTTPQQNPDGYDAGSPLRLAGKLGCRLLIMSGTADDNVHMSNTIEYASALQSRGILFDMMAFPNMNHSINGCNARLVVYAKMLDFFNRNL